jgi:hypothetical protein
MGCDGVVMQSVVMVDVRVFCVMMVGMENGRGPDLAR